MRTARLQQLACLAIFVVVAYTGFFYLNPRYLGRYFPVGFFAWFAALITLGVLFIYATQKTRRRRLPERMTPPPAYETVAAKIAEIEDEMKRVGLWQDEPLKPEQYNFSAAFAMDTMSFDQWLQFVFIPRVKEIIETRGEFPPSSQVASQAIREFDTYPMDTTRLHALLHEFDRLFGPQRFYPY